MKLLYKNLSLKQLILFISANLLLISCGTYQSVYNNDGIYDDVDDYVKEKKQIVIVDEKENEINYFTKKLETLESLNNNDFFTDVDSYNSDTTYVDDEIIDETLNYDANQPWGYEDNDVVVHVNLINNPYWYGYNNWNYYGNGYNNWQNRNYYNDWGYNPFWHPFHRNYAWNIGFYNPYYYNRPWSNNRNYTYGRRVANNTYSRRNVNSTYRTTSSRRNTSTSRRSITSTARRSTNSTSPTKRNATTTRRSSTTSRSTTPVRRSSSSSSSNNDSSTRRSTSSSRSSSSSSSSSGRSSRSSSSRSSSSSRKRGN